MNKIAFQKYEMWIRAVLIAAVAGLSVAGCDGQKAIDYTAEGEVWKQQIAEAYQQNDSLESYRFSGSMTLKAEGMPRPESSPPEVKALVPLLGEGLAWEGTYGREPLRMEAEVELGTDNIPLLIQDRQLYLSIPALNKPEEYVSIPLQAEAGESKAVVKGLKQASAAIGQLAERVVAAVDPQWVRLSEEDRSKLEASPAAEGNSDTAPPAAKHFIISVTPENRGNIEQALRNSLPEANLQEDLFDLGEGGKIALTINEAGYVTEQQVDLHFIPPISADADGGSPAGDIGGLSYAMALSELNTAPEITSAAPENVLPLEHILAFLKAGRTNSSP